MVSDDFQEFFLIFSTFMAIKIKLRCWETTWNIVIFIESYNYWCF